MVGGDRSINQFIYIICGVMTVSSGRRNWRDYRILTGAGGTTGFHPGAEYDPNFARAYEQARSEPAGPSLASQLRERTQQEDAETVDSSTRGSAVTLPPVEPVSEVDAERCVTQDSVELTPKSPPPMPEEEEVDAPDPYEAPASTGEGDDGEPPNGFLAGLADDGPPRQP